MGWMKRKAAATIGYYNKSAIDDISMEGQVVTVKSTGGSANRTTVFKFGDTVETDGPDGNHYKAKTKFEGGVWYIISDKVTITRTMPNNNTIVQSFTINGVKASRTF